MQNKFKKLPLIKNVSDLTLLKKKTKPSRQALFKTHIVVSNGLVS